MMDRETHSSYLELVKLHIEKSGQFLQAVLRSDDSRPFIYTIGNNLIGHPDLLIVGFDDAHEGAGLLNTLRQVAVDRGKPWEAGELFYPFDHRPAHAKLIATSGRVNEEFTVQAGQLYGTEDYRVLQVLLSDNDGRLPGEDESCALDPAIQRVEWFN